MLRSSTAFCVGVIALAVAGCAREPAPAKSWTTALEEDGLDAFHADFLAVAAQNDWGVVDRSDDTIDGIDLVAIKGCQVAAAAGSDSAETVALTFRDKCRDDRPVNRVPNAFRELVGKYAMKSRGA